MRIRLRIDRPGDLPTVKILWATGGLRASSSSFGSAPANAASLRIADLLKQVDEVIPLRLSHTWGLEDYVVEVGGFECLHFAKLDTVLVEDELVAIRPKTLEDVRLRRIAGRDQISTGGTRLYDGVPWDRPFMRAATRPAIEPPKKLARLTPEAEELVSQDEERQGQLVRLTSPVHRLEENADPTAVHPSSSLNPALPRRMTVAPTAVRRTDGRKVVKPVRSKGPTSPSKTVHFATKIQEVYSPSEDDSSSDEDFQPDEDPSSPAATDSSSNHDPNGDAASSSESSSSEAHNSSNRDLDSDVTSSSGSSDGEDDPGSSNEGSIDSKTSTDTSSQTSSVSIEPIEKPGPEYSNPASQPRARPAVSPGRGLTRTKARNERRKWKAKLRLLKDAGVLDQDADFKDAHAFFADVGPGDVGNKIAKILEARRKGLLESLATGDIDMVSGSGSCKATSLPTVSAPKETPKPATAEIKNTVIADDSWKDKVHLTAIECSYDRSPLPPPPFPFVQRWHQKGKLSRGQKRKRSEQPEEDSIVLDYGTDGIAPSSPVAHGHVYQQLFSEASELLKPDEEHIQDLPLLPTDLSNLGIPNAETAKPGALITFKEMEMSAATSWSPQISENKTAEIIDVNEDGTMKVKLALRDCEQKLRRYDPHNGQRIYARFEAPDLSDSEEDEPDTFRTISLTDLIEPLVIRQIEDLKVDPNLPSSSSHGDQEFQTPVQQSPQEEVHKSQPQTISFITMASDHPDEVVEKVANWKNVYSEDGNMIKRPNSTIKSGTLDDVSQQAASDQERDTSESSPVLGDTIHELSPVAEESLDSQVQEASIEQLEGELLSTTPLVHEDTVEDASDAADDDGNPANVGLQHHGKDLNHDANIALDNKCFDSDITDDSLGLPSISLLLSQPGQREPVDVSRLPPSATAPAKTKTAHSRKDTTRTSPQPRIKR